MHKAKVIFAIKAAKAKTTSILYHLSQKFKAKILEHKPHLTFYCNFLNNHVIIIFLDFTHSRVLPLELDKSFEEVGIAFFSSKFSTTIEFISHWTGLASLKSNLLEK